MICARCDGLIKDGEEYTKFDNPGGSVGGTPAYRHAGSCRRAQLQTAPKHMAQVPAYQPPHRRR